MGTAGQQSNIAVPKLGQVTYRSADPGGVASRKVWGGNLWAGTIKRTEYVDPLNPDSG